MAKISVKATKAGNETVDFELPVCFKVKSCNYYIGIPDSNVHLSVTASENSPLYTMNTYTVEPTINLEEYEQVPFSEFLAVVDKCQTFFDNIYAILSNSEHSHDNHSQTRAMIPSPGISSKEAEQLLDACIQHVRTPGIIGSVDFYM